MMVQRMQQYKENLRQKFQAGTLPEEISLDELDETTIATRIAEVEAADEIEGEETIVSGLWILNARGVTEAISPVTDAAEVNDLIGLQLVAEKIKATEYGVLYEVHWGRILHGGENVVQLEIILQDFPCILKRIVEDRGASSQIPESHQVKEVLR